MHGAHVVRLARLLAAVLLGLRGLVVKVADIADVVGLAVVDESLFLDGTVLWELLGCCLEVCRVAGHSYHFLLLV